MTDRGALIRMSHLARLYRVPGVAATVAVGGIVTESTRWGMADEAIESPILSTTRFQIASVSKIVTAWATLALVADGALDLDEPIAPRLRRWSFPRSDAHAATVTLRHLLSHTAAMPSAASRPVRTADDLPSLVDVVAGRGGTPAAVPDAPPGAAFRYSNPGYALVELLVEVLSGTSFAEWAHRRVLRPLNMTRSSFERDAAPGDAAPHGRTGRRLPWGYFSQHAAGGLLSTSEDLIALALAMTPMHEHGRGGGVLPPQLVEQMWVVPPAAEGAFRVRNGGYALGQIVGKLPSGPTFVANQGSRPGWRSLLVCLPDDGHALAVTTNSNRGLPVLAHLARSWLRHGCQQRFFLPRIVRLR